MTKFQLQTETKNGQVAVKVIGTIDEDASFSPINYAGAKSLTVDFKAVEAINSCGVREWIRWLETVPQDIPVEYYNCPSIIVDQINMVGGFLRKGVRVMSFYIPYFCDNCKLQTNVLVTSGKDFNGPNMAAPDNVKCSNCNGPTEVDVMESKYFKFMTRQG